MFPSAIDHIILAIFISEHKLINRLCAIMKFADQWFAQIIFKRPIRFIGNGYPNAAYLISL